MIVYTSKSNSTKLLRFLKLATTWQSILVLIVLSVALVTIFTQNLASFLLSSPPKVIFSYPSGKYNEPFILELGTTKSKQAIRYTLDGSEVSHKSKMYILPIPISESTVVRAGLFDGEELKGEIFTSSYYFEDIKLPVVSLVTDPKNLWDPEIGIYVDGINAVPDKFSTRNYAQTGKEWERPVTMQVFENDGKLALSANAGVRVSGGRTRENAQKSLRVCAQPKYGSKYMNYKFFPDRQVDKFKCIVLRNSGNDWKSTMMRDGLMQSLVSDLEFDTQAYRPAVVYLNGKYWGIHNIVEYFDDDYLKYKYGVDRSSAVIIEPNRETAGYPQIKEGDSGDEQPFVDLLNYIKTHDITQPDVYKYVQSQINIENFIDYNITEIFFANNDWPDSNVKIWRLKTDFYEPFAPKKLDGRWNWFLFDTDVGFGLTSKSDYEFDTLFYSTNPIMGEDWSTILLSTLLKNENFKQKFISRYAELLNTNFQSEKMIKQIDKFSAEIRPEIPRHIEKWGGKRDKGASQSFATIEEWEDNVNELRIFARNRPAYARQHIFNNFEISL